MKMLINGKYTDASDGAVIEVFDPAAHELLDTVPAATKADVDLAIEIAQKGKALWGGLSVQERTDILCKASAMIEAERVEMTTLLAKETGKPYRQADEEIGNAVALFKGYAQKVRHFYDQIIPAEKDFITVIREPVGVVACIVPFNFPIDLYSHKVAPALAAGNAVIIKPSSETPLCNIYISELLIRAGVPKEAVQVVTGRGSTVGTWLAESPKVNAISLTGSTNAGVSVRQTSAKNLSRVFLELGGNDPMIVFGDIDPAFAAREAVNGRILNAGQACCSTKRFIVHNSIKGAFSRELVNILSGLKLGKQFDPQTQVGCLINEREAMKVEEEVRLTVQQGARCILGGRRLDQTFFEPTVLTDVPADADIAKDMEVFGPVFPIIGFETVEEAIQIANQTKYGLSSGILCSDLKLARKLAAQIDAGGVCINGASLFRTFDMPFGGHKMSGMGTEGFYSTLDEYFKTKSIIYKGFYD